MYQYKFKSIYKDGDFYKLNGITKTHGCEYYTVFGDFLELHPKEMEFIIWYIITQTDKGDKLNKYIRRLIGRDVSKYKIPPNPLIFP